MTKVTGAIAVLFLFCCANLSFGWTCDENDDSCDGIQGLLQVGMAYNDIKLSNLQTSETNSTKKKVYRQPLYNFEKLDASYTADVVIGGQVMPGILDTGSFEVVVFSSECEGCGEHNFYNHKKSDTYHRDKSHTDDFAAYGSGTANSHSVTETVGFGPLIATDLSIWEAYEADMPVLKFANISTIVGVGPPGQPETSIKAEMDELDLVTENKKSVEAAVGMSLPTDSLEDANEKLEAHLETARLRNSSVVEALGMDRFSVCLEEEPGSDGWFIWHDDEVEKKPQAFTDIPVIGKITWGVKLSAPRLAFEGKDARSFDIGENDDYAAIVDSGTSLLVVPNYVKKRILEVLKNISAETSVSMRNCTNFDMSGLPNFNFKLGGHDFSLPPDAYLAYFIGPAPTALEDMIHGRLDMGNILDCDLELAVMSEDIKTDHGDMWIVGMPFLRYYYTHFNLEGGKRSISTAPSDGKCQVESTPPPSLAQPAPKRPRTLKRDGMTIGPTLNRAFAKKNTFLKL